MKSMIFFFMIIIFSPSALALFGLFESDIIVASINLQEGSNINLNPSTITGFGTIGLVDEPVIDGNLTINGDLILRDRVLSIIDQEINASFLPTEDDKFDLGSSSKRWMDGFFSGTIISKLFSGNTSSWSRTGTDVILTNIGDNVGIGTTSPNDRLEVVGNVRIFGSLNMTDHNITDAQRLDFPDGTSIRFGTHEKFSGMDNALNLMSNRPLDAGAISHAFVDMKGGKILRTIQVGLPDAAGLMANSQIISNVFGITNGTKLSRCSEMANQMGIDLEGVGCNTTQLGAALIVEGSARIAHKLVVGGGNLSSYGIQSFGFANFNLEGQEFIMFNGSLHLFTPRIEEIGIATGGLVTIIDEDFEDNSISPFQKREQVGNDENNWRAEAQPGWCHDSLCAVGDGGNSFAKRIMELNISTIDRNKLNISFYHGDDNTESNDNCSLIAIESGNEYLIWNYSATAPDRNPAILIEAPFPSALDDKSKVSLQFIVTSNSAIEECFVDNVLMVGSASASTRQNVTRRDTIFLLGDGNQRIFWNDSSKVLELPPNATIISESIQDLIVSGTFTLGSVKISDFDDLGHLKNNIDINATQIYHDQNITHWRNSSFGIFNNGTCIVIGDLSFVDSEC